MERERERGINGDILEEKIFVWRRYFERDIFGIWWKEKKKERKRKEEKGKEIVKEKIFSLTWNSKISET